MTVITKENLKLIDKSKFILSSIRCLANYFNKIYPSIDCSIFKESYNEELFEEETPKEENINIELINPEEHIIEFSLESESNGAEDDTDNNAAENNSELEDSENKESVNNSIIIKLESVTRKDYGMLCKKDFAMYATNRTEYYYKVKPCSLVVNVEFITKDSDAAKLFASQKTVFGNRDAETFILRCSDYILGYTIKAIANNKISISENGEVFTCKSQIKLDTYIGKVYKKNFYIDLGQTLEKLVIFYPYELYNAGFDSIKHNLDFNLDDRDSNLENRIKEDTKNLVTNIVKGLGVNTQATVNPSGLITVNGNVSADMFISNSIPSSIGSGTSGNTNKRYEDNTPKNESEKEEPKKPQVSYEETGPSNNANNQNYAPVGSDSETNKVEHTEEWNPNKDNTENKDSENKKPTYDYTENGPSSGSVNNYAPPGTESETNKVEHTEEWNPKPETPAEEETPPNVPNAPSEEEPVTPPMPEEPEDNLPKDFIISSSDIPNYSKDLDSVISTINSWDEEERKSIIQMANKYFIATYNAQIIAEDLYFNEYKTKKSTQDEIINHLQTEYNIPDNIIESINALISNAKKHNIYTDITFIQACMLLILFNTNNYNGQNRHDEIDYTDAIQRQVILLIDPNFVNKCPNFFIDRWRSTVGNRELGKELFAICDKVNLVCCLYHRGFMRDSFKEKLVNNGERNCYAHYQPSSNYTDPVKTDFYYLCLTGAWLDDDGYPLYNIIFIRMFGYGGTNSNYNYSIIPSLYHMENEPIILPEIPSISEETVNNASINSYGLPEDSILIPYNADYSSEQLQEYIENRAAIWYIRRYNSHQILYFDYPRNDYSACSTYWPNKRRNFEREPSFWHSAARTRHWFFIFGGEFLYKHSTLSWSDGKYSRTASMPPYLQSKILVTDDNYVKLTTYEYTPQINYDTYVEHVPQAYEFMLAYGVNYTLIPETIREKIHSLLMDYEYGRKTIPSKYEHFKININTIKVSRDYITSEAKRANYDIYYSAGMKSSIYYVPGSNYQIYWKDWLIWY